MQFFKVPSVSLLDFQKKPWQMPLFYAASLQQAILPGKAGNKKKRKTHKNL